MPSILLILFLTACKPSSSNSGNGNGNTDPIDNPSGYFILATMGESDPFYQALLLLQDFRQATILHFDPADLSGLLDKLKEIKPRYLALIMKPLELDINFARRFLMISTQVDDDPFADFSYGFITGANADDARQFVQNIIDAERGGIENQPLSISGWAASSLNLVYTSPFSWLDYLKYQSYHKIILECGNPATLDFFRDNTSLLEKRKLLSVGHNGDPHMLWLFEGGNMVEDTWDFSPELVENPPVSRLGLTSHHIAGLSLYPAVALNGACHSGVLKRALVEGDILATWGDTHGKIRFYTMSDGFSFALNMLKTGITGYFAPIGSNNANDQSEDVYNLFLYQEPLGDIHKRSNDALVMGFLGNRPKLRIFKEGDSTFASETLPSGSYDPSDFGPAKDAMLSGKANRIYFGDPMFNPFKNDTAPELRIISMDLTTIDSTTLRLEMVLNKPATAYPIWDKFHHSGHRLYSSVELPIEFQDGVNVEVLNASGYYHRIIHALEHFCGKVILHIEVDIPGEPYTYDPLYFSISMKVKR